MTVDALDRLIAGARTAKVGVDVPIPVPMACHSFGGWRDPLFGDTPTYGTEGVKFSTPRKAVTARRPDPAKRGVDLGFPTAT